MSRIEELVEIEAEGTPALIVRFFLQGIDLGS